MRKLFILFFWCFSLVSNAQGELHFVKTLPINDVQYSMVSNECQLQVVPTTSEYLKLEVSVYSNTSDYIIKQLFRVGRYNITINDGKIEFNRLKSDVFIKGKQLNEDIVVKIHAPIGVEVLLNVNELLN